MSPKHAQGDRNRRPNRRVKPQRSPASLPRVPNRNHLLRINDRLAVGLGTLRLGGCTRGGSLAFLRSAIGTHSREVTDQVHHPASRRAGLCFNGEAVPIRHSDAGTSCRAHQECFSEKSPIIRS
jgi:hypothetical protein